MSTRKKDNVYIKNRPATFHHEILDKYTAGIVLTGTEIKSIRKGKVSFVDSFCIFQDGELFVKNLHIAHYENGGYTNHDTTRVRKLLLNRRELNKWMLKVKEKGMTIVPLSIFINENGLAKMEIGLGRGKKIHDKRESIKEKDMQKALKRENFYK